MATMSDLAFDHTICVLDALVANWRSEESAELQQEALARRLHFTLKTALLSIFLSSDGGALYVDTQDGESGLFLGKTV